MDFATVQSNVDAIAAEFASQRGQRQLRRHLDPADFARLSEAGFTLTGAPTSLGGLWTGLEHSARPICNLLRSLAHGDPSVALVSAMHPAVLSFWLMPGDVPAGQQDAWAAQQRFVARTAVDGAFWGTITSEPGSGGDVGLTKSVATLRDDKLLLSGQKHFGSGSGIASYMITTAIQDGDNEADWFFLDVRNAAWDGSTGMKLISEWDGHGMIATQSHAFEFSGYPATRFAWQGDLRGFSLRCGALITALFTAVIAGVVDEVYRRAKEQLGRKREALNPYEQTEWTRVENEKWLIDAAFERSLQAIEAEGMAAGLECLHAKTAIAELAESLTGRICKVVGGGTFHRGSPFGAAFEDVRALGFLRPPWGLAYDTIWERSWQ